MKHRRASGFLLAALIGAGVSLAEPPSALSQFAPDCEHTATSTALNGGALDAAVPVKIGVTFTGTALVLSGGSPGKVISQPLDLAALGMADTQMVITGARLYADFDGDVTFFLSGSESSEWVQAHPCDNDVASQELCARFPKSAGRSLRWMAVLRDSAGAPAIRSVQPVFDYLADTEHYRGGIAVHQGVAYLGGFSQPGDLGQLYATSLDFGTQHWRAREELQGDGGRNIFTANGTERINFTASTDLQAVLGAVDLTETSDIVAWVRDNALARFGVDGAKSRFGGVISSTPVVVGRPELPTWFLRATPVRQSQFQTFRRDHLARPPLVFYGAKDGMVHALHTDPLNLAHSKNGEEAWAFVPTEVAGRMRNDFATSVISAYPDTWPVIDDVLLGGQFATVAVLAHGRGGTGISAIDITDSVTGSSGAGYVVNGPQPLWERSPQDVAPYGPGLALNRPAVARVTVGGNERYMVIAGTGISYHDPDAANENGRIVAAYDVEDGTVFWKFRTMCPLTTAITVFETNDQGEANDPLELDGFADRAVFGDRCGYVYKVDLVQETAGGWTTGLGGIPTEVMTDGTQLRALFQTDLGRPVTGNIAARAVVDDDTTRVSLFFGTGGLDEEPPYLQNTFYALAAAPEIFGVDVPEELVLARIVGDCFASNTNCEKFYGGVRVNPQQVIFTRVLEPPIGVGVAACDLEPGRTIIEARSLIGDISSAINQQLFARTIDGVLTGPLTMVGNAIYFADGRGRMTSIGDTSAGGNSFRADQLSVTRTDAPMLILGWRQVY